MRNAAPPLVFCVSVALLFTHGAGVSVEQSHAAEPVAAEKGKIETGFLEQPWKRQRTRSLEVGRWPVVWRERAAKKEGIFAGLTFVAPVDRKHAWDLSSGYDDLGKKTPGIKSIKIIEESPNRQVVQAEVEVLWRILVLNFEVEQEPMEVMRFRLSNPEIGEYIGVCRFTDAEIAANGKSPSTAGTALELSTWFKPARPVPAGLILMAQRIVMLRGARTFLESCARRSSRQA